MTRVNIRAILRDPVQRARLLAYATRAIITMMRWG